MSTKSSISMNVIVAAVFSWLLFLLSTSTTTILLVNCKPQFGARNQPNNGRPPTTAATAVAGLFFSNQTSNSNLNQQPSSTLSNPLDYFQTLFNQAVPFNLDHSQTKVFLVAPNLDNNGSNFSSNNYPLLPIHLNSSVELASPSLQDGHLLQSNSNNLQSWSSASNPVERRQSVYMIFPNEQLIGRSASGAGGRGEVWQPPPPASNRSIGLNSTHFRNQRRWDNHRLNNTLNNTYVTNDTNLISNPFASSPYQSSNDLINALIQNVFSDLTLQSLPPEEILFGKLPTSSNPTFTTEEIFPDSNQNSTLLVPLEIETESNEPNAAPPSPSITNSNNFQPLLANAFGSRFQPIPPRFEAGVQYSDEPDVPPTNPLDHDPFADLNRIRQPLPDLNRIREPIVGPFSNFSPIDNNNFSSIIEPHHLNFTSKNLNPLGLNLSSLHFNSTQFNEPARATFPSTFNPDVPTTLPLNFGQNQNNFQSVSLASTLSPPQPSLRLPSPRPSSTTASNVHYFNRPVNNLDIPKTLQTPHPNIVLHEQYSDLSDPKIHNLHLNKNNNFDNNIELRPTTGAPHLFETTIDHSNGGGPSGLLSPHPFTSSISQRSKLRDHSRSSLSTSSSSSSSQSTTSSSPLPTTFNIQTDGADGSSSGGGPSTSPVLISPDIADSLINIISLPNYKFYLGKKMHSK